MTFLWFQCNELTALAGGGILSDMSDSLQVLDLHSNHLEKLPDEIGRLKELKVSEVKNDQRWLVSTVFIMLDPFRFSFSTTTNSRSCQIASATWRSSSAWTSLTTTSRTFRAASASWPGWGRSTSRTTPSWPSSWRRWLRCARWRRWLSTPAASFIPRPRFAARAPRPLWGFSVQVRTVDYRCLAQHIGNYDFFFLLEQLLRSRTL